MKYSTTIFCAALFFAVAGCGSDRSGQDAADGAAPASCGLGSDEMGNLLIRADAESNYSFSSSFSIDVTPVAPNSELTFDWSGVTRDFLNHEVDPLADIDMITLMSWRLSQQELEAKLNDDALAQRDLVALATIYTENSVTSGGLFDFTSFGVEIEPSMLLAYLDPEAYDPATHSYTVMAVTGTTAGEGTRMMQSFRLDPSSDETHVVIHSDSTALEYTVDLTSLTPVQVPLGAADVRIDWTDMTVNALGNEFETTSIDEVLVARYALTPAEMEEQFLDLDLIADELWRGSVPSGTSTLLSSLTNAAGEAFAGIDGDSTWIVALVCGDCANPAPWYITILEPCAASSAP